MNKDDKGLTQDEKDMLYHMDLSEEELDEIVDEVLEEMREEEKIPSDFYDYFNRVMYTIIAGFILLTTLVVYMWTIN